ncbi:MAG: TIM barrel protein [Caldilineaceae bacterium]
MTELYVAAGGFTTYKNSKGQTRKDIAGNATPADSMTDSEFKQFAKVLNSVGEITLEQGVTSCFTTMSVVPLRRGTRSTGSLRWLTASSSSWGQILTPGVGWGRCRPVLSDYADSIKTMHIKDDPTVMAEGVHAKWHYDTFSKNGVWTELGQGAIDFPALFKICDAAGFSGWIIVETDVTNSPPHWKVRFRVEYLRSLGL